MELVQERVSKEFHLIRGLFELYGHEHIVEPMDIDKDDEGRICVSLLAHTFGAISNLTF